MNYFVIKLQALVMSNHSVHALACMGNDVRSYARSDPSWFTSAALCWHSLSEHACGDRNGGALNSAERAPGQHGGHGPIEDNDGSRGACCR
jgi:hypothetical protein